MRTYTPEQREAKRQYDKENSRKWRLNNPEEAKKRRKENYLKNKEKILQQGKDYYNNNKEKYRLKHKKWNEANPNKRREYQLAKYGLTLQDYEKMFEQQKGLCYTCHNPETKMSNGKVIKLSVDHNHTTGKVRKLLCYSCNLTIGKIQENIETLKNFIKYLEEN
jgi:hypothetical protein